MFYLEGFSELVQSTQNRLGYLLRNFLSWEGPAYQELAESTESRESIEQSEPAQALLHRYDLASLMQSAGNQRYLENLQYLQWLDIAGQSQPDAFQSLFQADSIPYCLDVGAKNWAYLNALLAFTQFWNPASSQWHGVELDPHRRYRDLRTRKQYAQAYIQQLPQAVQANVYYQSGNILKWQQSTCFITHFLPFVFKSPHLAWGLPGASFQPDHILAHLLTLLEPGGLLFIVNQGPDEAEEQAFLLKWAAQRHAILYKELGCLPADFIEYRYPRYGWLVQKLAG